MTVDNQSIAVCQSHPVLRKSGPFHESKSRLVLPISVNTAYRRMVDERSGVREAEGEGWNEKHLCSTISAAIKHSSRNHARSQRAG
jgi:hypothetical protein